jgi:hypothetical protein
MRGAEAKEKELVTGVFVEYGNANSDIYCKRDERVM